MQLIMLLFMCCLLVSFTDQFNCISNYHTSYIYKENTTFVIETKEELDLLVKDKELKEQYDEEYFNEKQLVLVIIPVTSSDISYTVIDYILEDNVLNIEMKKNCPLFYNMMMSNCNVLIEVDKVEINDIKLNIEK